MYDRVGIAANYGYAVLCIQPASGEGPAGSCLGGRLHDPPKLSGLPIIFSPRLMVLRVSTSPFPLNFLSF